MNLPDPSKKISLHILIMELFLESFKIYKYSKEISHCLTMT